MKVLKTWSLEIHILKLSICLQHINTILNGAAIKGNDMLPEHLISFKGNIYGIESNFKGH